MIGVGKRLVPEPAAPGKQKPAANANARQTAGAWTSAKIAHSRDGAVSYAPISALRNWSGNTLLANDQGQKAAYIAILSPIPTKAKSFSAQFAVIARRRLGST